MWVFGGVKGKEGRCVGVRGKQSHLQQLLREEPDERERQPSATVLLKQLKEIHPQRLEDQAGVVLVAEVLMQLHDQRAWVRAALALVAGGRVGAIGGDAEAGEDSDLGLGLLAERVAVADDLESEAHVGKRGANLEDLRGERGGWVARAGQRWVGGEGVGGR